MVPILSSLLTPEVDETATSDAIGDDKVGIVIIIGFQRKYANFVNRIDSPCSITVTSHKRYVV